MSQNESRKSYQKAILLTVAFVVVLIIANSLLKFASTAGSFFHPHLDGSTANQIALDANEFATIRNKTAGFWECNGLKDQQQPFLSVFDRIELKDNGIFWRVRRDVIHLASGDSVDFVVISNGYMQPYSRSKTCADSILFQVHFIGQVMIAGNDTCYAEHARMSDDPKKSIMPDILRTPQRQQGEVAADTAWDIAANGKVFGFESRPYSRYDTAGAALYSFFPKGATKLVGMVSISQCRGGMSPERFAKQTIVKDFAKATVPSRTQQDILNIIDTYYKAIGAQNLARSVTRFGKGTVTLSFSVTPQGAVVAPKVASAKPWNMRLNDELKKELLTWIFPKCASQKAPVGIEFSFQY